VHTFLKKIGLSSAALAMAFCYFSGLHPLPASAASNTGTLVSNAIKAGKVLSDATTVEHKATGTTVPQKEYNDASSKYNTAKTAVNKLSSGKTTTSYMNSLKIVSTEIDHGKKYIYAVNDGKFLASVRALVERDSKASTVTTQLLKDYSSLSSYEKKYSPAFDAVYGTNTRNKIKSIYQAPAIKDLNNLSMPVKVKNAILTAASLSKTSTTSSKLADQYKIIVFNMDSVAQSSYKDQLKKDTASLAAAIPSKYKTGQLAALIKMEPQYEQLNGYVSKWKSNSAVPGIYTSITSEISSFSGTDKTSLQNRLSAIMNRLKASPMDIKTMLGNTARKNGIPPEVVKSIALAENGSLAQFTNSGEVFTSPDNGYGIMQVTPLSPEDSRFDWNRVKYDLQYNIDTGVQILKEKWGYNVLPVVNPFAEIVNGNRSDPKILENWYFAIMAYNGVSLKNDPNKGSKAYQEQVYKYLYNDALLEDYTKPFLTNVTMTQDLASNLVSFNSKSYKSSVKHLTTQMHKKGDTFTLPAGTRFRQGPSTSKKATTYTQAKKVTLTSGPSEDAAASNMYCWYQVSITGVKGTFYVASINLQ
jgi:hypothetical protein